MPQQPPPQSPRPDQPVPTPEYPQQAARPATPPEGYATQGGHRAGPVPVPGRVSASGGYRTVSGPGAGYAPSGPAAPGYGPVGPPPGYGPVGDPTAMRPTQALTSAGATTAVAAEPKKKDLTVNKLIAGAGAAATSAVLGSFFGALGTVGGAALGSVFSAVVTSLYQHSLDKTRDTVKAKVKLPGGTVKVARTTEVPAPRGAADQASTRVFVTPGDQPTEVLSAVPALDVGAPRSRRRLLMMTGFTVVVFAIGMLAITGIELVKGSPLNTSTSSAQQSGGTSLGTVLGRSGGTEASTETATPSATESAEPTSEATTTRDTADNSSAEPRTGFGADEDEPATPSVRPTPTPTPASGSGADQQSDQDGTGSGSGSDSGQSGGGAAAPGDQQ